MRITVFFILLLSLISCASRKAIQRTVAAHSGTFPLQQLGADIPASTIPTDIVINNGLGLPAQTEVVRAGILILPLLFYNHFQSSYQVVLGQDVLQGQWSDYVDKRLKSFAQELSENGINNVKLEIKKVIAHGKYVSGNAYLITPNYYYNTVQQINLSKSKNATAEVAISLSWTDNAGNEESRDASVTLTIAKNGIYSGQVRTLLGKTMAISSNDIKFHFNHNIHLQLPFIPSEPMMSVHIFRLSDLLVLSLDELCETILMESKGEEVKPLSIGYTESLLQARNLLWERLRGNKLGKRFIKGYSNSGGFRSGSFYDFVSNKAQLTLDVGSNRQGFSVEQYLFSQGQNTSQYNHLYFTPEEIVKDMGGVIQKIKQGMH